jgi:hypothetical protein
MPKFLVLALLSFMSGIVMIEAGVLSVLVSVAYRGSPGSLVPMLAGLALTALGSVALVLAVRLARRKDPGKGRPLFDG